MRVSIIARRVWLGVWIAAATAAIGARADAVGPGTDERLDQIERLVRNRDAKDALAAARLLDEELQRDAPESAARARCLELLARACIIDEQASSARSAAQECLRLRREGLGSDPDPRTERDLVLAEYWSLRAEHLAATEAEGSQEAELDALEASMRECLDLLSSFEASDLRLRRSEVLLDFGVIRMLRSGYAEAEQVLRTAIAIERQLLPPDEPQLAFPIYNLAITLRRVERLDEAGPLYEEALQLCSGAEDPRYWRAFFLSGRAVYWHGRHRFAEALEDMEEADALLVDLSCENSRELRQGIQNNMAYLSMEVGDLEEAEQLLRANLEARRLEARQPGSPSEVAQSQLNLGRCLMERGEFEEARELLDGALENFSRGGSDANERATVRHRLGILETRLRRFDEALVHLEAALALYREHLGNEHHLDLAVCHLAIGVARLGRDDAHGAIECFERVEDILDQSDRDPRHPLLAELLLHWAEALEDIGDAEGALRHALDSERVSREHLLRSIATLAPRPALEAGRTRARGLSLSLRLATRACEQEAPGWRNSVRRAASAALAARAPVLRESSFQRGFDQVLDECLARKLEVEEATRAVRGLGPDRGDELGEARRRLERALGRQKRAQEKLLLTQRERPGLDTIRGSLGRDEALLSFFLCEALDGGRRPARYVALLSSPDRRRDPVLRDLGPADELDSLVTSWRREVHRDRQGRGLRHPDVLPFLEPRPEPREDPGQALRRVLWDGFAPMLDGCEQVSVVMDGALNLVNLMALPTADPDRYLIETGPRFHYPATEREVVDQRVRPARAKGGLLAVGVSDFGAGAPTADQEVDGTRTATAPLYFGPLDQAAEEARGLQQESSSWGIEGRALLDAEATEAMVRSSITDARYVHFSTHGFFREAREELPLNDPDRDPLHRAGLALSGANRAGSVADSSSDGLLRAGEIATMDFSAADCVVMSACDTGLGEIEIGEGVFGLRRAFQLAGARSTVMTLWPVHDDLSPQWSQAFYEELLTEGSGPAEATRQASLRLLQQRRDAGLSTDPFYWGAWISAGAAR